MADIKDGGPAFPVMEKVELELYEDGGYRTRYWPVGGMSLRDYFAGQALAGVLANQMLLMTVDANSPETTRVAAAVYAYAVADAMLEARTKQ